MNTTQLIANAHKVFDANRIAEHGKNQVRATIMALGSIHRADACTSDKYAAIEGFKKSIVHYV